LIRVVVVAPYASVRAGIRAMLAASPWIEVIGEAVGSDDLRRLIEDDPPDAVLIDYFDPDGRASLSDAFDARIPVVGLCEDIPQARELISEFRTGIGCLLKDASGSEIAGALTAAAAGLVVLHPAIDIGELARNVEVDEAKTEPLTSRESEVLQLMAAGLPNKVIAVRLGISAHTVKFHVAAILSKLRASSRTEAVTLGIRGGKIAL
jgi:DNA-binding NarL/FixJ family response regulator